MAENVSIDGQAQENEQASPSHQSQAVLLAQQVQRLQQIMQEPDEDQTREQGLER